MKGNSFFFTIFGLIILSSGIQGASAERYFANVQNGTVKNVIVADLGFVAKLPGTWIETFRESPGKTYAGIGYLYNFTAKNFMPEPLPISVKIQNDLLKAQYEILKASWTLPSNVTNQTQVKP